MSTTTNALAPLNGASTANDTSLIEDLIAKGDLAKLSPEQRARYYITVCESIGLNPLTQPFAYITLNGKLVLYATKGATDQLRGLRNIDVRIVSREIIEDLYVVTAEARTPEGRTDSDIGAVSIAGLKGDALANAIMKATSKSKRRVTLSLVGLGMLDESEVATVPSARVVNVDPETGEILALEHGNGTTPDGSNQRVDIPAVRSVPELMDHNATPRQLGFILALGEKLSLSEGDVDAECQAIYQRAFRSLNRNQASEMVDRLTARQRELVDPETGEITDAANNKRAEEIRELTYFRSRYEMATTSREYQDLFTEAENREEFWLAMVSATTVLKRLERLAEVAAEKGSWTGALAEAYAERHAALTERATVGM